MEREEIRRLDRIAANATAATTIVPYEGWDLRANDRAPFRRTNSALALGPVADLDAAVDAAQDFYAARELPTRFQVSPASRPATLDDTLAARGYEVEAPVVVAVAPAPTVVSRTAGGCAAMIGSLDERWVAQYAAVHGDDEVARTRVRAYGEMLRELAVPVAGALVAGPSGEEPLGLGFAVAEDGWAGIYGMGTRPAARRTGVARAVLHALARWAAGNAVDRLYLQVEVDNPGARALYDRAGFTDAYGYHYRTRGADLMGC